MLSYPCSIVVASAYLAPIQYYAHLMAANTIVEDIGEHFVKQSYRTRCYIASPQGKLALTLPIERTGDTSHTPMCDIRLSDHGRWQHQHWQAIQTAYENTPFFEYYADELRPHYEYPARYLWEFNASLQTLMLDWLNLDIEVTRSYTYVDASTCGAIDLRTLIHPKIPHTADTYFALQPYYQVFGQHLSFLPNLSILDLVFNMGPEGLLVLRDSIHSSSC